MTYMTPEQVSKLHPDLALRTVSARIKSGHLPAVKVGSGWCIAAADAHAFADSYVRLQRIKTGTA